MTTAIDKPAAGLPKPQSNRDFDFFYQGLEAGQLLVQCCSSCRKLRNPPGPMCPACHSLDWQAQPLKGNGTVFSYTVHHHPKLPSFDTPHVVVLVDMEEGVRVLGAMPGIDPERVQIGMQVQVEFLRRGETATFQFRA
ncbi:Zn-ribbon domain-containing OB-fold protein [Hydrogenophaga sp.]|uniref:Zn-ribbon domain-containing OB-fold protein n=1 Tax=Hydrogenophaga sp. TaxID=1904254 RepID=UPI00271A8904|nr:OB-fold domain-containing protein [Hydrogenophaga sp.]MDO9439057.1 OB-fold domain-containing protein [Hydrogenophaga sp.]